MRRVDGHFVLALELRLGDHPHDENGEDDQNDAENVEEDSDGGQVGVRFLWFGVGFVSRII